MLPPASPTGVGHGHVQLVDDAVQLLKVGSHSVKCCQGGGQVATTLYALHLAPGCS